MLNHFRWNWKWVERMANKRKDSCWMATATNSINSIDMYFERFVKIRIDLNEPETQNTESITFSRCSTFIVTWILWETKMKTMLYFAYFHIMLFSTFENLSIAFVFFCSYFVFLSRPPLTFHPLAFRYIANRSVKHTWPIHSMHKNIVNMIRMTNCHEFTANIFASMALSVCSRFFWNLLNRIVDRVQHRMHSIIGQINDIKSRSNWIKWI